MGEQKTLNTYREQSQPTSTVPLRKDRGGRYRTWVRAHLNSSGLIIFPQGPRQISFNMTINSFTGKSYLKYVFLYKGCVVKISLTNSSIPQSPDEQIMVLSVQKVL